MLEVWKPIPEFEDYQVSSNGRVKITANSATRKERILKPLIQNRGYYRVALWKDNKPYFRSIHRLVAQAFITYMNHKPQVNHIDGDKSNNHFTNLEWCTAQENMEHSVINRISACGERNGKSKLKATDIPLIRERLNNKERVIDIASDYNVSGATIYDIKNKRTWQD
jgi:hypothetical protein